MNEIVDLFKIIIVFFFEKNNNFLSPIANVITSLYVKRISQISDKTVIIDSSLYFFLK